ncbi:MAG: hypothetical protein CM15mP64_6200 [Candidatus Neomarinimicrobiota bacterium]|nr:MAG: hypothetical protein CM15mP64_6200 [Candidatus Neomarinimicrobiota bacterium]
MANVSSVNLSDKKWNESGAGIVAVGVYEDKSFTSLAQEINDHSDGALENAVKIGDVKGKNGEVHLFYVDQQRVMLLGLGKKEEFDSNKSRLVAGEASKTAIKKRIGSVAIECFSSDDKICQALGEGLVLGSYQFLDYKTNTDKHFELESAMVLGCDNKNVHTGASIANAVCLAEPFRKPSRKLFNPK